MPSVTTAASRRRPSRCSIISTSLRSRSARRGGTFPRATAASCRGSPTGRTPVTRACMTWRSSSSRTPTAASTSAAYEFHRRLPDDSTAQPRRAGLGIRGARAARRPAPDARPGFDRRQRHEPATASRLAQRSHAIRHGLRANRRPLTIARLKPAEKGAVELKTDLLGTERNVGGALSE
jgi:hypothetical protein